MFFYIILFFINLITSKNLKILIFSEGNKEYFPFTDKINIDYEDLKINTNVSYSIVSNTNISQSIDSFKASINSNNPDFIILNGEYSDFYDLNEYLSNNNKIGLLLTESLDENCYSNIIFNGIYSSFLYGVYSSFYYIFKGPYLVIYDEKRKDIKNLLYNLFNMYSDDTEFYLVSDSDTKAGILEKINLFSSIINFVSSENKVFGFIMDIINDTSGKEFLNVGNCIPSDLIKEEFNNVVYCFSSGNKPPIIYDDINISEIVENKFGENFIYDDKINNMYIIFILEYYLLYL